LPPGLNLVAFVLGELGVDPGRIGGRMRRLQGRALLGMQAVAA
jgi:hypothetical protein